MPRISIILLTKNAQCYIEEQIRAIFSQIKIPKPEIIVIDSGSTDRTLEILSRYPVNIQQIPPYQFNHGQTRNLGAKISTGDYLVYLSQDATPASPFWLANLVCPLMEDSQIAAAFSRHIPRPGCNLSLKRQITEEWAQQGGLIKIIKKVANREELEKNKPFFLYFSNTSSCLRRTVWEKIEFPEISFGEDAAWAEQVLLRGYSIVYEPASAVFHSHDYSWGEQMRQHYDYGRYVRELSLAPAIRLSNSVKYFLKSIYLDWRYLRRGGYLKKPECSLGGRGLGYQFLIRLTALRESFMWHLVAGLGRYLGEHSRIIPESMVKYLSLQEKYKGK